jgi:hypothetical protein
MKLKYLALSDTHLGEDTSLLGFPPGRRHLGAALRELFSAGQARVEVDELILLGDIPDRALSSTAQILTQTHAFMHALAEALRVRRIVYVPGNHDHTLWTAYDRARAGGPIGTSAVAGELLGRDGAAAAGVLPAAEELLELFPWLPDNGAELAIANPIYAQTFLGRTYLFTHGTHFRADVTAPRWLKRLVALSKLDEIMAGLSIEPGGDLAMAADLAALERIITPFVNSVWPSSRDNPAPRSAEAWYLLSYMSGKFGKRRPVPTGHCLASWAELAEPGHLRYRRLTPEYDTGGAPLTPLDHYSNASIDRCRRWFLDKARQQVRAAGLATTALTFVYGDTHEGGVGRLPGDAPGQEMRVYNTGAWVVHERQDHPPCHLFAVADDGNEYLADVSFKDVRVARRTLLAVAAEDAENKKRAASRLLRAVLAVVPSP